MKKTLLTFIIAALVATITVELHAAEGGKGWATSFEAAKKEAKEKKRPILVVFSGSDWCHWCVKLDKEVFQKKEWMTWAKENVVLYLADFPRKKNTAPASVQKENQRLAKKFGISGFPSVLLLDSNEKKLAKFGYQAGGPTAYIKTVSTEVNKFKKANEAPKADKKAETETDIKPPTKHGWYENFADAQAAAKAKGLPILIDFTGSDWCGWCIKLDKEVFKKAKWKTWAKSNVILYIADFPRKNKAPASVQKENQRLQKKYGVRGFPTIIVIDADGKLLGRSGYKPGGPANYIKVIKAIIKK